MTNDFSKEICPLCNSQGDFFYKHMLRVYLLCKNCKGIFVIKEFLPGQNEEKERYLEHNNDVNDKRYQNFVSPIINSVLESFSDSDKGLDYGAGTGPVITKVLRDKGYDINLYDPFFHKIDENLQKKYNYIACCEVIEHFFEPYKEFKLLHSILKPNGKLFCMTHMYSKDIDFKNWYYKSDPTHVFIYQNETMTWIQQNLNFSNVEIKNRLITFKK